MKKALFIILTLIAPFIKSEGQSYQYDNNNRLVESQSNCSGLVSKYDANGNLLSEKQVTITTNHKIKDEYCGNDGKISILPKDSSAQYLYLWNNGNTTSTITNLSSGTYSVTIKDPVSGFSCNQTFTIKPAFKDSIAVITSPTTCYQGNDGNAKIKVVIKDTIGSYEYRWDNEPDTIFRVVDSANNLIAGKHSVDIRNTVTRCVKTLNFVIGQPPKFLTGISQTPLSCYQSNDGTATATVIGDSNQYSFVWSGPFSGNKTGQTISGLAPGSYIVICTAKSNNCAIKDTIVITEHQKFLSVTKIDSKCYKSNSGSAAAVVPNDPTSYTFVWKGPQGTIQYGQNIHDVGPGIYVITATENFGNHCTEQDSITIEEPQSNFLEDVKAYPINCKGQNDGAAQAIVSGSETQYRYQWFFANANQYLPQNSAQVVNLQPGSYKLTVTDMNGCSSIKNFVITENSVYVKSSILYPNPSNGKVTAVVCNLKTNNILYTITSSSGAVLQQGTKNTFNGSLDFDLSGFPPATYLINVVVEGKQTSLKVVKL